MPGGGGGHENLVGDMQENIQTPSKTQKILHALKHTKTIDPFKHMKTPYLHLFLHSIV